MIRRVITAVVIAILLVFSSSIVWSQGRGRLGGRHGTPAPVQIGGVTYYEILTAQTIDTSGYCTWPDSVVSSGPIASTDRVWIAWMRDASCSTGSHSIMVSQYDYLTGLWTTVTADSINPSCCDGHDVPSLVYDADSKINVFYGSITAGRGDGTPSGSTESPYHLKSTAANSIAAFDARTTVPNLKGGFSDASGGNDSNGDVHILGQHQYGNTTNGLEGFNLDYARRISGTWTGTQLVNRGTGSTGGNGAPGCFPAVEVKSTSVYVAFSRHVQGTPASPSTGCSTGYKDIYFIKSTDSGSNWSNAAGTSTFTFAAGLVGTLGTDENGDGVTDYTYDTAYRAFNGSVRAWDVDMLSDGTPVIVYVRSTGTFFIKWTGSAWSSPVTIDASATGFAGVAVVVTSTDKILVYSPTGTGSSNNDLKEWVSTDGGANFTGTVIRADGSETCNRYPHAKVRTVGGKERVLVQWAQCTVSGSTSNFMYMDRPQS